MYSFRKYPYSYCKYVGGGGWVKWSPGNSLLLYFSYLEIEIFTSHVCIYNPGWALCLRSFTINGRSCKSLSWSPKIFHDHVRPMEDHPRTGICQDLAKVMTSSWQTISMPRFKYFLPWSCQILGKMLKLRTRTVQEFICHGDKFALWNKERTFEGLQVGQFA